MSGSAYRLEAPRPRPPPPPLRVRNSAFNPSPSALNTSSNGPNTSTASGTRPESPTLLYDLPSAPSIISPQSSAGRSPTSPNHPGRPRPGRKARLTPPPSVRNRSVTPSGVAQSDLEVFETHCRSWYYDQSDSSGRLMTHTLANLPASQRAPFSRLQANIRSEYHAHINARRTAEFHAHLNATQPGGSLLASNRADPRGLMAQKERYLRFEKFVRSWCTMGMPGTKPFFEALWAVMRLQVVPKTLGGAGPSSIRWELDDAVFMEAAGKEFMLEAIAVLKGVLGFEETSSLKRTSTSTRLQPDLSSSPLHARSQSQPLPSGQPSPHQPTRTVQPKRARAPSDPFLDTPTSSRSIPTLSPHSFGTTALLATIASDSAEEPPSPAASQSAYAEHHLNSARSDRDHPFQTDAEEKESLRVWTSPDLDNPEYLSLLKVFPPFITRRALPRFIVTPNRPSDIEEAEEERGEGKEIQFGTGTMWISSKSRGDGWNGSWWSRFVSWCRKVLLFC